MTSGQLNIRKHIPMVSLALTEEIPVLIVSSVLRRERPGGVARKEGRESEPVGFAKGLFDVDERRDILFLQIINISEIAFAHSRSLIGIEICIPEDMLRIL